MPHQLNAHHHKHLIERKLITNMLHATVLFDSVPKTGTGHENQLSDDG